jgi:hypothetical protein
MIALAQSVTHVKNLKLKMKHEIMRGGVELDNHLTMLAMQVSKANAEEFSLHEYCANAAAGHALCGKIASLAQATGSTSMNAMQDVYISKLIV